MYQGDLPYQKRLFDVSGRSAISNCGAPTGKWSEFLNQRTCKRSCKRDAPILRPLKKIYNLDSIPENSILVNADVMGLYQSEPNELDLTALGQALEERNGSTFA